MPNENATPKENKVTFGLRDLTIFFYDEEGEPGEGIYIDSIVKSDRSMNTSTTDAYANDSLFFRKVDEKNGESTLETMNLPKAVQAKMLGWRIDSNGGLVHIKDAKPARFDMAFSVDGDQTKRRKFIYGCEAAVGSDNNETRGENVSFKNEQISITEFGVEKNDEHVWDYTIYENVDPEGFEKSKTEVVYPAPPESLDDEELGGEELGGEEEPEGDEPVVQTLDDDEIGGAY